ncbi:60S acidic ribosomal protein P1 [Bienertia sinuspersici]
MTLQAEKVATLDSAPNISIEFFWPSLFAKLLEEKNIEDLILNVGAGGGAAPVTAFAGGNGVITTEEKIEEKVEEKEVSDDDIRFSLFDD